jgi:polysaccharide export outer membrane protein
MPGKFFVRATLRFLVVVLATCFAFASPLAAQTKSPALVRPGDVIRLRIWREPDLSGEFLVNDEGAVVLPKVGRVLVIPYTADSLRSVLVTSFEVYLKNPSIEVTVLRRVGVSGAVFRPGLYPADASMSVADILLAAGGVTPDGDDKHIQLQRDGLVQMQSVPRFTKLQDIEMRSGDEFVVGYRPWIERHYTAMLTTAAFLATLLWRFGR